ncbi:MAG: hypothetical protein KBA26_07210, partial [Candidatus Delongbacteria bacterium]|nr:hypothetical protein [Candidatus Delongbacteria bacterium]
HLEPRLNLGLGRELSSRWGLGYNTASGDWDWQIAGSWRVLGSSRIPGRTGLHLLANARQFTDIQGDHDVYGRLIPSLLPLQGRREYWNYFRNRTLEAGLMLTPPFPPLRFKALVSHQRQRSVEYSDEYHLVGSRSSSLNRPIPEGDLNALNFELTGFERLHAPHPLVPEFKLQAEYTDRSRLNSDFSYQRYSGRLIWQLNTFYSRYLQPNYLRIMLVGGTGRGDLPPQRYGSLDGNLLTYAPFGVFHTRLNHPYQGNRWMAVYAKHNFRAIPFQWMGLDWAARRNWQLIIHAAAGRAWIHGAPRPQFHQEIGFSLVNIIPWVQLDLSRRLDQSGWVFSFSLHFN